MVYNKTRALAENKLLILYLVKKIEIPLSNSEIWQFVSEKNLMDYFSAQQYLSELVESRLLEMTTENNTTRYTITTEGEDIICEYAKENSKRIRAEYSVTANYFHELNSDDYTVKCGVCDSDGTTSLMEISINVATRDQARLICRNWRDNVNSLYGKILHCLSEEPKNDKAKNSSES